MVDAAPLEAVTPQLPSYGGDGSDKDVSGAGIGGKSQRRRANKKKNKKRRNSGLAPNITDINRYLCFRCLVDFHVFIFCSYDWKP